MKININRESDQIIHFYYEFGGKKFSHYIEFSKQIIPSDDSLFRLALFSRPSNSENYLINGIEVSNSIKSFFETLLKTKIQIPVNNNLLDQETIIQKVPRKSYLCFSGGFDSIAAKALIPERIKLLSINFGGEFERESDFFKEYNGNIVSWNLRGKRSGQTLRFDETIDWRFLLAPSLLYRKFNENLGILTGTIMEASPSWFSSEKRPDFYEYDKCYGPSVALINPVSCLTEYSTTLIANDYLGPEKIERSLNSLAPVNSLKFYRKKILLALVRGADLPKPNSVMNKHRFGTSFADDFLSIYFSWKCGKKWTLENYVDRLPLSANNIDMSYVEKANQNNLTVLDPELRKEISEKLECYKIKPYSELDFIALEKTKLILLQKDHFNDTAHKSLYKKLIFWKK